MPTTVALRSSFFLLLGASSFTPCPLGRHGVELAGVGTHRGIREVESTLDVSRADDKVANLYAVVAQRL